MRGGHGGLETKDFAAKNLDDGTACPLLKFRAILSAIIVFEDFRHES